MKTRSPKTKIITGCNDCPFCILSRLDMPKCTVSNWVKILNSDKLNPMHIRHGAAIPITPEDCPLKTQPIIVTYET